MGYGVGAPHALDIFSNSHRWVDIDDWNRSALALHEHGGLHRFEREGFRPFWAVVDHAAVLEIERNPELFTNAPEPILGPQAEFESRTLRVKSLVNMDSHEHSEYRNLTANWFRPSNVRRLNDRLEKLSRDAVQKLEDLGGTCDFAVDIALPFPLQVILKILGLPEEDYPRMLALTQQLFGFQDPDLNAAGDGREARDSIVKDFFTYFTELTKDRRESPGEDLATVIANGRVDDSPMPDTETLGYYIIIATAGHDATSSAMSGGMAALIEHPEQFRKLQDNPELLNNAVEEMLRWTAPVRHFMRTAQEDTKINGYQINKGDWLYLSYKAANLDPKVFDDPLTFDIERSNADRKLSFGFGVHFCLGAQLARNELRHLFKHVVPRIETIELNGDPTLTRATFVGGHKTLPIRYALRY